MMSDTAIRQPGILFAGRPAGGKDMNIPDARQYVGRECSITYRDRLGREHSKVLHIHDLTFIPLYGAYLVGDIEDVCLDKVTAIKPLD
jgi:hypothetical protein